MKYIDKNKNEHNTALGSAIANLTGVKADTVIDKVAGVPQKVYSCLKRKIGKETDNSMPADTEYDIDSFNDEPFFTANEIKVSGHPGCDESLEETSEETTDNEFASFNVLSNLSDDDTVDEIVYNAVNNAYTFTISEHFNELYSFKVYCPMSDLTSDMVTNIFSHAGESVIGGTTLQSNDETIVDQIYVTLNAVYIAEDIKRANARRDIDNFNRQPSHPADVHDDTVNRMSSFIKPESNNPSVYLGVNIRVGQTEFINIDKHWKTALKDISEFINYLESVYDTTA